MVILHQVKDMSVISKRMNSEIIQRINTAEEKINRDFFGKKLYLLHAREFRRSMYFHAKIIVTDVISKLLSISERTNRIEMKKLLKDGEKPKVQNTENDRFLVLNRRKSEQHFTNYSSPSLISSHEEI